MKPPYKTLLPFLIFFSSVSHAGDSFVYDLLLTTAEKALSAFLITTASAIIYKGSPLIINKLNPNMRKKQEVANLFEKIEINRQLANGIHEDIINLMKKRELYIYDSERYNFYTSEINDYEQRYERYRQKIVINQDKIEQLV